MESSSGYSDLLQPGLRRKKKKMERGERGRYDPERARKAEDDAASYLANMMDKKMGIKRKKAI